jgi:flagellar assembly protein FliH
MSSDHAPIKNGYPYSKPFHYFSTVEEIGTSSDAGGDQSPFSWNSQPSSANSSIEQREKDAFERGIHEGEARVRVAFEQQRAALQTTVGTAVGGFKTQREDYFSRIEPEVVQLALAIARKILHREAQMDPLLLMGMVHVALEKLDKGARVRLRANPGDIHCWNEYFSQPGAVQPTPELSGDPALNPGELALETDVGSTRISLELQLKEIEQGFFDLLEQRPRVR